LHHAQLTEYVTANSDASRSYIQTLQFGGLSLQQAGAAINRSIDVEAHLLAANDLFWVSAGVIYAHDRSHLAGSPVKGASPPGAAGGAH